MCRRLTFFVPAGLSKGNFFLSTWDTEKLQGKTKKTKELACTKLFTENTGRKCFLLCWGRITLCGFWKIKSQETLLVMRIFFVEPEEPGKTTTARLLAKAVNCLSDDAKPCGICANCQAIKEGNFVDLIELDAASNNGINDIRELRESVEYAPVVGKKKVYIIDEILRHIAQNICFKL